jgi:Domain of unknown function (DUF397)
MESPEFRNHEVGNFRKSRASFANGNCVEVGDGTAVVGVRDTQEASHPYRTTLEVPAAAWLEFTAKVKSGAVLPA